MQTYAALKTLIRSDLWPQGEAYNLQTQHTKLILEAIVDIATVIPCWQVNNTEIIPPCGILFRSGMSMVQAPRGNIFRVSTYDQLTSVGVESASASVNWDAEVRYTRVNYQRLKKLVDVTLAGGCLPISLPCAPGYPIPDNAGYDGYPELPQGFKYPQPSLDRTGSSWNPWGCSQRALAGIWGQESGRIYLAPWLQSTEWLAIEWDGIKRSYADTDLVSDDPEWIKCIENYVMWWDNQLYVKDYNAAAKFETDYQKSMASLNFTCTEQSRDHFPEERKSLRSLVTLQEQSTGVITSIPDAVVLMGEAVDANDILLTWTDPSNGRSTFVVQKLVGSDWVDLVILPPGTTTYTDTGLTHDTEYCYRVIARNSVGDSPVSDIVCVTTPSGTTLINVDFTADNPSTKVGVAATGVGSSDFWNTWRIALGTTPLVLKYADNTTSAVSIAPNTVAGLVDGVNGNIDPMLNDFIEKNTSTFQFTYSLTGLAAGTYDLYLYGYGSAAGNDGFGTPNAAGLWQILVNGVAYPSIIPSFQQTWNNSNVPPWVRAVDPTWAGNYALMQGIVITAGQTLGILCVYEGGTRKGRIGGLQLVRSS